jgi:hypothetical protein
MTMRGSCLCGTLRYEIDGPFTMVMNCHCSMCRKHHGAPFATFAAAPLDGFRWLAGQDSIGEVQSSAHGKRYFCKVCGSVAPLLMPDWKMAVVFPGNLEDAPDVRVEAHIFVGSKAPWYSIEDDLPQHAGYPPSFAGAKPVPRAAVEQRDGVTLGSCLCGDVAYEMTGAPQVFYQCHCSRCRRARSAAHGANLFYTLEQFRWVRGESLVVEFKLPEAARFGVAFCRNCGGAVPRVRGFVVAPAGALDTDPGLRPLAHICVASKAPWFEIKDAIPQLAGVPPLPSAPRVT